MVGDGIAVALWDATVHQIGVKSPKDYGVADLTRNPTSKSALVGGMRLGGRNGETFQAKVLNSYHGINKKQFLVGMLLWVALAVLLVIGMTNVSNLRQYPAISLRYNNPVSGKAAYSARLYSVENKDDAFWLTFWHETNADYDSGYDSGNNSGYNSGYNRVNAVCILFSGEAALVWPARYLSGTAPGVTDGIGCAVSSALARELWGGDDVVGKFVGIDDEIRVVRGVFEGSEQMALVSVRDEDTSRSFSAVELSAGPSDPVRSDAESFAIAAGLGRPDSILTGTPVALSAVLAVLPLVILALYGLALCITKLKYHPAAFRIVLLSVFLGFAVVLPELLDKLPGWAIPTRWSDFSFWGSLVNRLGDNLLEYLLLSPCLRDVEYKILLYKQIGISLLSVNCSLSICFFWHRNHYSRNHK